MKVIDRFTEEYHFLSNFYPVYIEVNNLIYPTLEHAYQAMKTFDLDERKKIRDEKSPGKAKRLARKLKCREDWDLVKEEIMKELLTIKFNIETFKRRLLETGESILIEGNAWHDNEWGSCMCSRCINIEGKNKLGKILMEVRNSLQEKEKGQDDRG